MALVEPLPGRRRAPLTLQEAVRIGLSQNVASTKGLLDRAVRRMDLSLARLSAPTGEDRSDPRTRLADRVWRDDCLPHSGKRGPASVDTTPTACDIYAFIALKGTETWTSFASMIPRWPN